MRDRKSLFLLISALIIVTISFVLISIWAYHFYYANIIKQPSPKVGQQVIAFHQTAKKDSFQSVVNFSRIEVENENNSVSIDSSVDAELEYRIIEFNRLKNEITEILRRRSSAREMSEANEKISHYNKALMSSKIKMIR